MTEITSNGAGGLPDPELVERPARRRYSAEYKLRIVAEADACLEPGEVGALLRREGLYKSRRRLRQGLAWCGRARALGSRPLRSARSRRCAGQGRRRVRTPEAEG